MKLFQITEDDLETLEQAIPELQDFLPAEAKNMKEVQELLSMLKKVASDVRWNYGPHVQTEEIGSEGVEG